MRIEHVLNLQLCVYNLQVHAGQPIVLLKLTGSGVTCIRVRWNVCKYAGQNDQRVLGDPTKQ
jgi:hypothetical protein